MSAQVQVQAATVLRIARAGAVPVVLLGVGNVGGAFLERLARLRPDVRVVAVANSRSSTQRARGLDPARARAALEGGARSTLAQVESWLPSGGIIVDATASDKVAAWHPRWLAAGLAVASANKAGAGESLARWRRIAVHASRYGDSATVGAGLPLLRTLRELRAGGDRILGIAGVLSGTLAWLLDRYDGTRPFAAHVAQAQALGLTEPDPRVDLSGLDVRRKLLILARSAGVALAAEDVAVSPLLPPGTDTTGAFDLACLDALDESLRAHWTSARAHGQRLRFVARLRGDGRASVGLEALDADDPLAQGRGCDNRVAVWSCRYRTQPLLIQGPGAGAEVTAAALLDDVLRLRR
ncbi:MAG: homoserine dehydrogenase [Arenimonas sp.]